MLNIADNEVLIFQMVMDAVCMGSPVNIFEIIFEDFLTRIWIIVDRKMDSTSAKY